MIHSSGMPVNFYTTGSWDRAVEKRTDAEWFHASLRNPATRIHVVWQGRTLVRHEDHAALSILNVGAYSGLVDVARSVVLLGCDAEAAHIAIDISTQSESFVASLGFAIDLRSVGPLLPPREASLSALARGMAYWHERHAFCGVCGAPTLSEQAGYQRRCSNASCNAVFFPRIDPAVIMRVEHGDRVLLGRQASWAPGMHSVMVGFVAIALDDKLNLNREEIDSAAWFTREQLINSPEDDTFKLSRKDSISRALVNDWIAQGR